jgi:molybdopterin-guanine dinucleotide biosynthesis protein A
MHVLILAQGQQQRLPQLEIPKQWINLGDWAPGGGPILVRTIRMIRTLLAGREVSITVVAGYRLMSLLLRQAVGCGLALMDERDELWIGEADDLAVIELAKPGNGSIAGLRQCLRKFPVLIEEPTTVLLGDVVYSHAVLKELLDLGTLREPLFAGTRVVTGATGELWGLRWGKDTGRYMAALVDAIVDPPVETYQAGQLRKLLWAYQRDHGVHVLEAKSDARWYYATNDFTADIDTPADMAKLPQIALAAWEDDQSWR